MAAALVLLVPWVLSAMQGAAYAQPAPAPSYPSRPLRMLIPAGAGGGVDTVARLVGAQLATALGQPVTMDNRPGAGTMLASELTAKAPPDGHTLLMVTSSQIGRAHV